MLKNSLVYTILLSLLLLAMAFSLSIGVVEIPVKDVLLIMLKKVNIKTDHEISDQYEAVLSIIRLPRVIMGVMIGAALAITGAALQGIFRNPLAEPGLVGISAGASLFAVTVIFLEISFSAQLGQMLGYYVLSIAAFMGACITGFLIYQLSKTNGKPNVTIMLLVGVAINLLSESFIGLMSSMSSDQQLRNITFWRLGSLGGASWQMVLCILPFIAIPLIVLPRFGKALNAFALGETQAEHLGIPVTRIKSLVIILATMAVGASVAASGVIGFLGLLVPHIIRLIVGADHKIVLPASALAGALILTIADLISRTVVAPLELPIGIITAFLGTPVFLYILMRDKQKFIQ